MRRRANRYIASIEQPIKGTSLYYTEGGACVFSVHYSADPEKTPEWVLKNSALYPGGISSAQWLQEMEMDDQAEDGERTYGAFDRERNLVEPFPVPADWPITLGFDFGQTNPTAVVFIAQDPLSRNCYVFDSVYRPKGIDPMITQLVYEKIALNRCADPSNQAVVQSFVKEMRVVGIDRFIDRAIGDPSGIAYAAYYATAPFPISIATSMPNLKLNDIAAGESHVNAGLTPRMLCCGAVQYNPNPGQESEEFACGLCGEKKIPEPSIYVMAGRADELVEQWESLIRRPKPVSDMREEMETPDKDLPGQPNHAADAARYAFRVIDFEPSGEAPARARENRLDALESKAERYRIEPHEEIELLMLRKQVAIEEADEMEETGLSRGMFLYAGKHQMRGKGRYGYGGFVN